MCCLLWGVGGVRGYKVVFIDLTPDQEGRTTFAEYRRTHTMRSVSRCWTDRKGNWIDIAYAKTQPIDLSQMAIRRAAAGDTTHVKEFARLLRAFRDDEISAGFDGAYIVTKENGQYVVTGLAGDASMVKASPVQRLSVMSLDLRLCAAAAAFDRSFIP